MFLWPVKRREGRVVSARMLLRALALERQQSFLNATIFLAIIPLF
jgi:hypothetical protein